MLLIIIIHRVLCDPPAISCCAASYVCLCMSVYHAISAVACVLRDEKGCSRAPCSKTLFLSTCIELCRYYYCCCVVCLLYVYMLKKWGDIRTSLHYCTGPRGPSFCCCAGGSSLLQRKKKTTRELSRSVCTSCCKSPMCCGFAFIGRIIIFYFSFGCRPQPAVAAHCFSH
jgi:hypothetical protein